MYTMVGVKRICFLMPESSSLKDKRQIIRKLRDSIKVKFNVSFAEISNDDKWQKSTIAISMVSSEEELIRTAFNQIANIIETKVPVRVLNDTSDIFRYENETEDVWIS